MSSKNRRPRRFFSPEPLSAPGQIIQLSPSESHHVRDTLRLQIGDICLITDGLGKEAEAAVISTSGDVRVRLGKWTERASSGAHLILHCYLALPQKGKMDSLVEKAQELGAERLTPLYTERTVVRISSDEIGKVKARWEKISREAAKQSGSLNLMQINPPISFKKALEESASGTRAVFHPGDSGIPYSVWIKTLDLTKTLSLFIGPEGGFSDLEIESVRSNHVPVVNLGETILKVDTAFIGILSSLRFLFS